MDPVPKKQSMNRTRTALAQEAQGSGAPIADSDNSYPQLSGDDALSVSGKYACCGSSRETILLDMASESLRQLFNECFLAEEQLDLTQPVDDDDEFMSQLPDSVEEPAAAVAALSASAPKAEPAFNLDNPLSALQHIVRFVVKKLSSAYDASTLEQMIAEKVKERNCGRAIPLEALVVNEIGLCRHRALFVGYLLAQWTHQIDSESSAAVYRFRTDLIKVQPESSSIFRPQGVAHAVTIYRATNAHLYLLDATRRVQGAEQGLAISLAHLNQNGRDLLRRCYPGYDVTHFLSQINGRYLKAAEPSIGLSPAAM